MKKYIFISAILLLLALILYIYKLTTYTYITAKFSELRPMKESIPVYYKGIIVGKAHERKHSSDFQHTLIKLALYPKNLLLPENTIVLLKKEKREKKERDFLELIYPKDPSNKMLSTGSTIIGEATVDVDEYMSNQKQDELDEIKENLAQAAQNLNYALSGLGQIFETVDGILKENKQNLYKTTSNFNNMTTKVNNSINEKKLSNSLSSIETSLNNTNDLTKNIAQLSQNLNSQSPQTLDNIEGISSNINSITCGIRKTLRKRFGTIRLLFGQVIDECE